MHAIYLLVSMRSKSLCRNRVSDTKVAFLTLWGFHSESGWRGGWPLEIPFIASRRNRIAPREFPSFRPAGMRVGLTEKIGREKKMWRRNLENIGCLKTIASRSEMVLTTSVVPPVNGLAGIVSTDVRSYLEERGHRSHRCWKGQGAGIDQTDATLSAGRVDDRPGSVMSRSTVIGRPRPCPAALCPASVAAAR